MFRLITDSAWLTLIILAGGLTFWWWSTYYLSKIAEHRIAVVLRIIRIMGLVILLLLTVNLQALWQTTRSLPPGAAIYVDNSQSMQEDADQVHNALQSLLERFDQQNVNYTLHAFGSDVRQVSGISALDFDEQLTDLSLPLLHVKEHQRERNIRAALIVSDGSHNSGVLPESVAPEAITQIPVYTYFIGDSVVSPDIRLEQMTLPRVVYAGDSIRAQMRFTVERLQRESTLNFQLNSNSHRHAAESLAFSPGSYSREMTEMFVLSDPGDYSMVGRIDTLPGEHNKTNNVSRRQIRVRPSRYQVLLYAEHPSYETRFAGQAIRQMERFSLDTFYAGLSPQPALDSLLAQADIVYVIGQPSSDSAIITRVQDQSDLRGVLFQVDPRGQVAGLNPSNANDWMEEGVQIANRADNPLLSVIQRLSAWERLPPIWTLPTPGLAQQSQRVVLRGAASGAPVIAFRESSGLKMIHILGQHVWRWEFAKQQMEEQDSGSVPEHPYRATLAQLFYWILQTSPSDRLQVWTEVDAQNSLRAEAQVYTTAMRPVEIAKVLGEVVDSTGQIAHRRLFSRDGEMYMYQEKIRVPGEYRLRTRAYMPTDTLEVMSATFRIPEINLEMSGARGNPEQLQNIGARYSGESLSDMLDFPISRISGAPNIRETRQHTLQLRSAHWIWGVLVVMFAVDWWIRRRSGLL